MTTTGTDPVLVVLAAGLAKRYGGCKPLAPIGLQGEAVIDLTASDARSAGFGDVVPIVGPGTGAAIEYHIRRKWPRTIRVIPAYQHTPLGTAHAVLCARPIVGDRPFAVVNGDDVYGSAALAVLYHFLTEDPAPPPRGARPTGVGEPPPNNRHALVSFRLADSVVGTAPVTRGTVACHDGFLTQIDERRKVSRQSDGTFAAGDARQPAVLDPATPVSVNLWGFRPGIWPALQAAVAAAGVHGAGDPTTTDPASPGDVASVDEVLLPEVVASLVVSTSTPSHSVAVLPGPGRCVGVTHAADLPEVRAVLATMVALGERPANLWTAPA